MIQLYDGINLEMLVDEISEFPKLQSKLIPCVLACLGSKYGQTSLYWFSLTRIFGSYDFWRQILHIFDSIIYLQINQTMEQRSSPPRHPRSASFTSSTKPTPSSTPSSIKPTSRARAYRIPNISSDAAGGLVLGEGGLGDPSGGGQTQEFLWATREIAALDFLMNVPLW
jgi:hypothetical protein